MCGVAGLWAAGGARPEHVDLVGRMLRTLRHRGPDGFSVHAAGSAVLGHARLAIIDLAGGDQPLGNEDGSIQCTFNGEIYNYRELRDELTARGRRLRTQSDTEVIPHLYEEVGDDALKRLRGMFVVALHDARRDRLLLARDRLGKKPLYYARTDFGLAYASEPRALLEVPGVDRAPDAEAVGHFLTWQYVPAPWTIFRGVRKLPAATRLAISADGETVDEFWNDRPVGGPRLGSDEALARLEATLEEACALRLRADVPLGAFLSGGIDSGLVTTLAARRLAEPLRAVTVGFGTADDELPLARLTARHAGARLVERMASVDVAGTVDRVLSHLDEPHGDASCVPTWIVCAEARKDVTVALSGDGGDETFAGYATRYSQQVALERLRGATPRGLRRAFFGAAAAAWPGDARLPRALRLKNVLAAAARDSFEAWAADRTIWSPAAWRAALTPEWRDRLAGFDPYDWPRGFAHHAREGTPLDRLLYLDRRTYLAEGVIAKVDRMSMAHSLEVRSPLLDHEVVELSLRVADVDKLRGGVGKILLRRLADRVLPPEVARARKTGFAPPVAAWLRGPLDAVVRERLLDAPTFVGELLSKDAVRGLYERHRAGSRDHSRELWCLLSLETWARTYAAQ
ncbi:MAG TPA: asparagine synthase (glutamine-hydrolyzing) [Planctomycetota bacterium]|nr:asparagine synthase (glutamine-hydrolyzing) [Planctomycetota bacterium]